MHRSFESGKPETLDEMNTIADSLGGAVHGAIQPRPVSPACR